MRLATGRLAMPCQSAARSPTRRCADWLALWLLLAGAAAAQAQSAEQAPPWKTNPPIVTIRKELYRRHTRPREAPLAAVSYVEKKRERLEIRMEEVESDVGDNIRDRWSLDNGRTWTDFVSLQRSSKMSYNGVTVHECGGASQFDPGPGVLVQAWLRQIPVGGLYHNSSLLEDRETHQLELHLTTYGQEPNPADWATADNYKYFLSFLK